MSVQFLNFKVLKCIFLHSKLLNSRDIEGGGNGSRVFLEFCKYTGNMESYIDYRPCLDNQNQDGALNICVQFSVSSSDSLGLYTTVQKFGVWKSFFVFFLKERNSALN